MMLRNKLPVLSGFLKENTGHSSGYNPVETSERNTKNGSSELRWGFREYK